MTSDPTDWRPHADEGSVKVRPNMILTTRTMYAVFKGEVARLDALAAGANWRRAKREGRKAREYWMLAGPDA